MNTTHTTYSAATGAGVAALLGIILTAPALADPAPIGAAESHQTTAVTRQGPPSYNTWPLATVPKQGPPSYNTWPDYKVTPAPVAHSDSRGFAIDYAQVALGALGGALITGVGALGLIVTRPRRTTAHA